MQTPFGRSAFLRPGLVESWRRIDDRTIEFRLQRGVRFHDSAEMTARDVALSFCLLRMWGNSRADLLEGVDPPLRAHAAQVTDDIIWRRSPTQSMDFRRENLSFAPR